MMHPRLDDESPRAGGGSSQGVFPTRRRMRALAKRSRKVEFQIQIQSSRWEPARVMAEPRLWTMSNVWFIEAALSSDVYIEETNKADITSFAVDWVLPRTRGSSRRISSLQGGRS